MHTEFFNLLEEFASELKSRRLLTIANNNNQSIKGNSRVTVVV